jgi:hypothetical protein
MENRKMKKSIHLICNAQLDPVQLRRRDEGIVLNFGIPRN